MTMDAATPAGVLNFDRIIATPPLGYRTVNRNGTGYSCKHCDMRTDRPSRLPLPGGIEQFKPRAKRPLSNPNRKTVGNSAFRTSHPPNRQPDRGDNVQFYRTWHLPSERSGSMVTPQAAHISGALGHPMLTILSQFGFSTSRYGYARCKHVAGDAISGKWAQVECAVGSAWRCGGIYAAGITCCIGGGGGGVSSSRLFQFNGSRYTL